MKDKRLMLEERQDHLSVSPILNDASTGSSCEEVITEGRSKAHGNECQRGVPGSK